MRNISLIIIILGLLTACKTHKLSLKLSPDFYKDQVVYDQTKDFKNQGEQEKYWTEELFKQKYKRQKFDKYSGEIKIIDDNHMRFGEKSVQFDKGSSGIKILLNSGVLYTQLLMQIGNLGITDLEEVTFVNHTDTAKRFRFEATSERISNPIIYFIELTNNNPTKETSIEDFIKGSELTFLKQGWTQI